MKDEYVVLVNENNEPIGQELKSEVHTNNTPLHRGFSVFLFNPKGELLLQQRSHHKKTWPLIWSNSCCGHPQPGEGTQAAAKRRLREELNLHVEKIWEVLPDFRYTAELNGIQENEICPVLICATSKKPKIEPSEVEVIKWIAWPEFLQEVKQENPPYSPWCVEEALLLAENEIFTELYNESFQL